MSRGDINYANVVSFERARGPKSLRSSTRIFTIVLLAVFFIALMIMLAAGVTMYRSVANDQLEANATRIQAGLLANTVHANDVAGAVGEGAGPEGRALVLTRVDADGDKFETRMYLYQGHIVQESSMAGRAYAPERAEQLMPSSTFDFELTDGLLVISTDHGDTAIALRSDQGDSQGVPHE